MKKELLFYLFLGAFRNLQEVTISFVTSPAGPIFMKFKIQVFFLKNVEKF